MGGMRFDLVVLNAKVPNLTAQAKQVVNAVRRTAQGEALTVVRSLQKTTATWHHRVAFRYDIRTSTDGMVVDIYTDDKIYTYVDQGTHVRYATMTEDFVPKTTPGVLGSGPGAGGLAYVNRLKPRPGIVARGFTDMVYKAREKAAQDHIEARFNSEVSKLFGG